MIKCLFIVALAAEARPLIDFFRLSQQQSNACRLYANGALGLLETGIGKLNAAGATAAALSALQQQQGRVPVCLNVGLAGAAYPLGSLLHVSSVCDQGSARQWYPQPTWLTSGGAQNSTQGAEPITVAVHTVDVAASDYQPGLAYDMEASGIFSSACRFTTLEFVQSLKVVSDNAQNPLENIDRELATELISRHCEALEHAAGLLIALADSLPDLQQTTRLWHSLCQQLHCSSSQRSRLQSLFQQYQACYGSLPAAADLQSCSQIRPLLALLESRIATAPRVYR